MDGKADVPRPRGVPSDGRARSRTVHKDNPARPYNRSPHVKLFDLPSLLVVLGLVVGGLLLAVLFVRVGFGA